MFSYSKKLIVAAALVMQVVATVASAAMPEKFNSDEWTGILKTVVEKGTTMRVGDGQAFHSLANITPNDLTKPHQAEYMSLMGVIDDNNIFNPFGVSAVSENWSINSEGNWVIDQWLFNSRLNGELVQISHNILVEKPNGSIVDYKTEAVGAAQDKANLDRWGAKIGEWTTFTKK